MPWIFGTVVQQWWNFAGDSDRNHVNLTNIQYVVFTALPLKPISRFKASSSVSPSYELANWPISLTSAILFRNNFS